ncbi:21654_t:CDS:2, partial [Rhizophagus irregularis]
EPSRRFETNETSRKDPQNASKLTKRLSRRFETDETSWKVNKEGGEPSRRFGTDETPG